MLSSEDTKMNKTFLKVVGKPHPTEQSKDEGQ